jgi:hypothetical protein
MTNRIYSVESIQVTKTIHAGIANDVDKGTLFSPRRERCEARLLRDAKQFNICADPDVSEEHKHLKSILK